MKKISKKMSFLKIFKLHFGQSKKNTYVYRLLENVFSNIWKNARAAMGHSQFRLTTGVKNEI